MGTIAAILIVLFFKAFTSVSYWGFSAFLTIAIYLILPPVLAYLLSRQKGWFTKAVDPWLVTGSAIVFTLMLDLVLFFLADWLLFPVWLV